jgi:hypothetical protein
VPGLLFLVRALTIYIIPSNFYPPCSELQKAPVMARKLFYERKAQIADSFNGSIRL